jgi:hypothetical protein
MIDQNQVDVTADAAIAGTMTPAAGTDPVTEAHAPELAVDARQITGFIQDAIDMGATTVEDIHRAIASLPFRVLEEVGFLERPAAELRRVQDRSIGSIYHLVREINHQVNNLAGDLLSKARPVGPTHH